MMCPEADIMLSPGIGDLSFSRVVLSSNRCFIAPESIAAHVFLKSDMTKLKATSVGLSVGRSCTRTGAAGTESSGSLL